MPPLLSNAAIVAVHDYCMHTAMSLVCKLCTRMYQPIAPALKRIGRIPAPCALLAYWLAVCSQLGCICCTGGVIQQGLLSPEHQLFCSWRVLFSISVGRCVLLLPAGAWPQLDPHCLSAAFLARDMVFAMQHVSHSAACCCTAAASCRRLP
jgi:hypothetical protein